MRLTYDRNRGRRVCDRLRDRRNRRNDAYRWRWGTDQRGQATAPRGTVTGCINGRGRFRQRLGSLDTLTMFMVNGRRRCRMRAMSRMCIGRHLGGCQLRPAVLHVALMPQLWRNYPEQGDRERQGTQQATDREGHICER